MASRIQKSIMNAKVNAIFYVVMLVLAFFSRKYFLKNLGDEFVGLTGTLGDMLNLMNITELGIGTAVGVSLYKPLFSDDHETISDIVSVYGFLYTRVGTVIAAAGILLSLFFPLIFAKAGVPLYVVYLMFYSMLYASLLGYFINYRQIILSASQQNYVIFIRYNTAMILKTLLQIAVSFLPLGYVWWILIEAVTITIYSFVLNRAINKYFPWLETSIARGKAKFKEYRSLWKRTKQVFVLKLSHLVLNSSTNMLTYAFVSLSMVAMYGNYLMLMSKATSFVDGFFTGMEASVGNLIAEGDRKKTLNVFYELLSIRYFLAGLCSIVLYFTVPLFVYIWLGGEYNLSPIITLLLSLHIFMQQARLTVDNFKNGYALYQDVWAPVAEVIINVGVACLLGHYYGLSGILFALVLSELIIKMLWKPYYLFKKGFEVSVWRSYWPLMLRYGAAFALCAVAVHYVVVWTLGVMPVEGWLTLVAYCFIIGLTTLLILSALFFVADKNFSRFATHLQTYRKRK